MENVQLSENLNLKKLQVEVGLIFEYIGDNGEVEAAFGIYDDAVAALTSHLTKQVLEELLEKAENIKRSIEDESFAGAGEFGLGENLGKRVICDKMLSLIRSKLNTKDTEHGK